ncbi:Jacalin-like lectin domain [Phytophthora cactorum]|nr:Jacalin-like lectin domain [Phytophthora cactorum]
MEAHWGKKSGRTRIFYLSFGTSAGNSVSGGSMTEDKNSVTAPEGFQLGGFFGRDGDEIDSLGAIWARIEAPPPATEPPAPATEAPAPPKEEPAPSKEAPAADPSGSGAPPAESTAASGASAEGSEAPPPPGTEALHSCTSAPPAAPSISVEDSVQLSESFGGPHGTEFSDEAAATSGQTVASITIRAGERVEDHGGTGGDPKTLKLGEGEYITSMEAHWGKKSGRTRIFYLSFGTSAGNSVSAGTQTEDKNSVTAPKGFQLGGFFGRDGDEIDTLGAIWTSIELVTPAPTEAPAPAPAEEKPGPAKPADSPGSGGGTTTKRASILSESFGGPHGNQFSDQPWPSLHKLSALSSSVLANV